MRRREGVTARFSRDRAITLWFMILSLALAFWQRPGWATADTKIDLHVDPVRFLSQVASVWTSTTDLGEVHSAQYSGYLWPMGPFFAALHSISISAWVVQRLWLALMFALATWGILRLLDVLIGRPRSVTHVVAATFYLLNPYVVVFTARTTITLLGYAALPWLLLVAYHGVRTGRGWLHWRSWVWPAAFALIFTSTGGGVNAAVVGYMLIGPLVLLVYEPVVGAVRWRDSLGFLIRASILGVLVSLWWIVPLLVHVRYGIDFLQFTEQPATIWGTNNLPESLRLMGYWTSYIGVGFNVLRPYFSDGSTLLFDPWVVGASLLLPALALAGFARAPRRRATPLFLALVLVGVVAMTAGFPDGTPLRGAMDWLYKNVFVLRFMRTNNKAAPLVAVGLAGLLGVGAGQLVDRLRGIRDARPRRAALAGAGAALVGLIALAALPLISGGAIDTQLEFKRIPAAWTQAGQDLDRRLPPNSRAFVLPGQIFAYYTWGGTIDPILPRLTSRPVAVRYETPYSDLHAVDLLTTVDDLVQQRRLVPGELAPLLRLMGVGAVITGSDDDTSRSGAIDPAVAAGVLSPQLGRPARSYGAARVVPEASGDVSGPVALPEVRRYDTPVGRGIVHVDPVGQSTILDGGAQGLADLAAFGGLPAGDSVFYAGDLSAGSLRAQAAQGASIVISDSNRRREFLPESTQQNRGPTEVTTDPLPTNAAVINPFPLAGTDGQTVAVLQGAQYIHAPIGAGELQFPEHAPIAAFDGDLSTSWVADRNLALTDRWIEIGFVDPRNVPYVDVYPLNDAHGTVTEVDVNGIHHAVGSGWTRIVVNLRRVSAVRVTIDHVIQPKVGLGGPGGFREIRIPGVHVRELLRPPVLTARALAGTDLRRDALTYLFERTTGDDPFRRNPYGTSTVLDNPQDRGDAERYIDRLVFAPAARSYTADAWVYPAVGASDSALDHLVGASGPDRFDSSSRFQDQPAYRASAAFDGRPGPGWIGVWLRPQAPAPWISWQTPALLTVSHLRLAPPGLPVRRPTVVQLSWRGGATPPLAVSGDGSVVLPAPVRARGFRLTVLQARFPPGASAREREAPAVGIGAISVPGLPAMSVPQRGALRAGCGTVSIDVGGRRVPLSVSATVGQLDAGLPLPAHNCGGRVQMGAGLQEIRALPGVFSIDLLDLVSPAPAPAAVPSGGGRVVDPGSIGQSSVGGVRVALRGRSWLVLGESYDAGWQATCGGRSLGAPQPIDGYANGWLAPAGCRRVAFAFAPQNGVRVSYYVSALVCLVLVALLLVGVVRRRARPVLRETMRVVPEPATRPRSLPQAALIALIVAAPVAGVFALRAGAVSFPIITLVLWRGLRPAALTRIAVLLLGVAVPITYVIVSPRNQGGYDFNYSSKLIAAHWLGVAAVLLLGLAAVPTIAALRAQRTRSDASDAVGESPTTGGGEPPPRSSPQPAGPAA
jgi:arabinofuranan 3-O-arabinosyltransferase